MLHGTLSFEASARLQANNLLPKIVYDVFGDIQHTDEHHIWYSCRGLLRWILPSVESSTELAILQGSFFYLEDVALRRKPEAEKAGVLLSYLEGDAFDYLYNTFSTDGGISEKADDYEGV